MDSTELGAIGELVGGTAVLITLGYLALRVRSGNEQTQKARAFARTGSASPELEAG